MAEGLRFAKSAKGTAEIGQRHGDLRGKLRIMLILVDPTKTEEQLQLHAARIGAPIDSLETLQRDGYIEPVGGAAVANRVPGARGTAAPDEHAQFAKAKSFMNDTLAPGLGPRAANLRAQLGRCTTRSDLKGLLPEYEATIANFSGAVEADMLAARLRKLLA